VTAEPGGVAEAVTAAYRTEWTRVLSTVIRVTRDVDLAEDCVQDAYALALLSWARDGMPERAGAWLTTVAVRQALQVRRRAAAMARKLPYLASDDYAAGAEPASPTAFDELPDDRLRLVFTCCHPALSPEARVALTLRLVCGLTAAEIASAFLIKETAMQARITRAKKKIAAAGIPYRTPVPAEFSERLTSVLDTVHLVYTAGHTAAAGETLMRTDLADLGLQIARMLHELIPDDPETGALLALLLLTDARRDARMTADGDLIQLEHQDRSRWDRQAIAEGAALLRHAIDGGSTSRYVVMASITEVHDEAATWADTDWARIVHLYELLLQRWPSPVVALNRAIAIGIAKGPAEGLAELAPLMSEPLLSTYPYLQVARAEFLRRLGRDDEAASAYREALLLTENQVEAAFLRQQLAQVTQ
jgi:RNA polymerase sigma-70 factor (ECF subfamily)